MSKPFKETVEERARRDPEFRKALEEEIEANKRMDIIGQNGNDVLHYEEVEDE